MHGPTLGVRFKEVSVLKRVKNMTEERQGPTQGVRLKEVSAKRALTVLRIFFFTIGCRWYSFRRR